MYVRSAYWILVGKMRPLVRPRRRWEDNFTIYIQKVEWGEGHGLV